MNYKYAFPSQKLPLVVIEEIWFQLPEMFVDEESE
jgi:hypothetical protein